MDETKRQEMRELLVKLLREYGVTADLDGFDNEALKKELERVIGGIANTAEKGPGA